MPRPDLYRNVHMGQRARLFALVVELGAADTADSGALARLADRCLAMTQELREHADHENTFIHPLLRARAPAAAEALDTEHVRLDAALRALDERARELPNAPVGSLPEAQHGLYLVLNEFISAYLTHLHAEETVAMPALWDHCTDNELGTVFGTFRASRTPEQSLTDLYGMLPALPPAVRANIVRTVLAAGSGAEAGRTLAAISTTLSTEQRTRLFEDLEAAEAWAMREGTAPRAS